MKQHSTQNAGPRSDSGTHSESRRLASPVLIKPELASTRLAEDAASQPFSTNGFLPALKWALTRRAARWPKTCEQEILTSVPERGDSGEVSWVMVGHSTVLLQLGLTNILLDPIWSERCSPVSWLGPRRVRPAAVAFEALPPIDIVLVSHNHYDHCDRPTLKRLQAYHDPVFVTGRGVGDHLRGWQIDRVTELDWWSTCVLEQTPERSGLKIQFTPSKHFSARGLLDRNRTLWGGFWITGKVNEGQANVYFCGDTGWDEALFREIHETNGRPDLAFLPIGAYDPRWFMAPVHVNPEEAVLIHRTLKCPLSVGMHCATFQLTDEDVDEPEERLVRASSALAADEGRFVPPQFGERQTLVTFHGAHLSRARIDRGKRTRRT